MGRGREKGRIGFCHMARSIYQMCWKANPPYCIFNQSAILSYGIANAGTVVATQLFGTRTRNALTTWRSAGRGRPVRCPSM